jgi:hypothetical protein
MLIYRIIYYYANYIVYRWFGLVLLPLVSFSGDGLIRPQTIQRPLNHLQVSLLSSFSSVAGSVGSEASARLP